MYVSHGPIRKELIASPAGFILTNMKGGFFSAGAKTIFSRYCGMFVSDENFNLFRTIEDIRLEGKETDEITVGGGMIERASSGSVERFSLHGDVLSYDVRGFSGNIILTFDFRGMYDLSDEGRIYGLYWQNGLLVVEYTKHTDNSLRDVAYKLYMAVEGIQRHSSIGRWIRRDYEYDNIRDSNPRNLYVYDALRLHIDGASSLQFSCALTKDAAVAQLQSPPDEGVQMTGTLVLEGKKGAAYRAALHSLSSLCVPHGIYAGLPWFHQLWTRDEAISLGALICEKEYAHAKTILMRHLEYVLPDGRVANRYPASALGSADGVGLTFMRISNLLTVLAKDNKVEEHFSVEELLSIQTKLKFCITHILHHHTARGLVINNDKETWMDTSFEKDTRSGFRIEVQALQLAMYRLMRHLCGKDKARYDLYERLEGLTLKKVRETFWKKPVLLDGMDDPTIRPNIFLACYAYPDLLDDEGWEACFDHSLNRLFLEWGGVASIDKQSRIYCPEHTGEDNRSYHRGDSWYFMNNIAAICMHRINPEKYRTYIDKIFEASCRDLLQMGYLGHASEISSASRQEPRGCLSQAWSSATLIELFHELGF